MEVNGKSLVAGMAYGKLLHSSVALSLWGGVDPETGIVIDEHHPLRGKSISGSVLALPSGRGSCTGSMLLLELLLNGKAPSALVLGHQDEILTLGVLVADLLFDVSIPVVVLSMSDFLRLSEADNVSVHDDSVSIASKAPGGPAHGKLKVSNIESHNVVLSSGDRDMLSGDRGEAARLAMQTILSFATLQGASELVDVSRAHIDSCIYTGPASLTFAEKLLSLGGKVAVPTTMNSISIDSRLWRELGMPTATSVQAEKLARAYVSMGAQSTFTCAPYSLPDGPSPGDNLGWGESNAVIFANSVLGARTQKYPDLLDVCIALTGRAPLAGCHLDEGRRPVVRIRLPQLKSPNDASYAALGYLAGNASMNRIPLIYGLEHLQPSMADLKGFSAAFGTSSSAPMFHISNITPEAERYAQDVDSIPEVIIEEDALRTCIDSLNTAKEASVGLVSLGNPHFLLEEFESLSKLCHQKRKYSSTEVIVTTSQATYLQAAEAGYIAAIEAFGVQVITDTCWCMISEPVIRPHVKNIMTNSAKYAHYAPGMCRRGVHFGSLAQCLDAACTGSFKSDRESLLEQ